MAGLSKLVNDDQTFPERIRNAEIEYVHRAIDIGVKKREIIAEGEKKRSKNKMFRISSIGYCLRKIYYDMKSPVDKDVDFLRKCNVGTEVHGLYQSYLALTGQFLGNYVCTKCSMHVGPMYYNTGVCPNCNFGGTQVYDELVLINRKRKIAGSPDGFLKLRSKEGEKAILTEFKTITPYYKIEERANIMKFVPEHIHQANFYLGIIFDQQTYLDLGDIDILRQNLDRNRFLMIYHDKGNDKKHVHPFKFDPTMYSEDKARVRKFWNLWKQGMIPDKEADSRKCKWCAHISECTKKAWRDNKDNG